MHYDKPCRITNDPVTSSCICQGLEEWHDRYELQLQIPDHIRQGCIVFIRSNRLCVSFALESGIDDLFADYMFPADADRDKVFAIRTLIGLTVVLPKKAHDAVIQRIAIRG